jgi:dihydropyrimidinase
VEWRDSTADEILECIHEHGIKSFKCYMAYKSTVGLDDDDLFKVMQVVGKAGALVTLHCEDGDAIARLRNQYAQRTMPAAKAHLMSRPPELEAEAVKNAITLAKKAQCPIYIVHVSSLLSLAHIREAQKNGQAVYAETCPQYLLLDKSSYSLDFEQAAAFVMSPPLRTVKDNEALWESLAKGSIATLGTDHCPFTLKQKMQGQEDFRKIPNGAGGIEHRLALLYSYGFLKNKIDLQRFVEITSTRAAQTFGLYPRKGIIAQGADADLVIWNPKTANIISSQSHHQNSNLNIYEGNETLGAAETVIAGGKIYIENGNQIFA